jgi:hypothetical protein
VNDHMIAQHTNLGVALDDTLEHVATRDRADLGDREDLADFDQTQDLLALLGRQHAGQRALHLIDGIVDDVVVAQIHAKSSRPACGHWHRHGC